MNKRILCVDDDPNLLDAYQRQLRKHFELDTALGPEIGLTKIAEGPGYAVVVSDMRMPGMDGVQFLSKVRQLAPSSVRMMLTGNSDLGTAVEAVNQGHIFRFMTKPCARDVLVRALEDGLEQHRLIVAEKELLSKTLSGSVKLLTDILSRTNPTAFGRAARTRALMKQLADKLMIEDGWQLEIAAMLSQVGCVALAEETLAKIYRQLPLSPAEQSAFDAHPQVGHDLLANIPRMELVAQIIAYQEKRFDGCGPPAGNVRGPDIPLGARILKVALDFDTLLTLGQSQPGALVEIGKHASWYDPAVVQALEQVIAEQIAPVIQEAELFRLPDNAILAEDVTTTGGTPLVSRGQIVTPTVRMRLKTYGRTVGVRQPIKFFVTAAPTSLAPAEGAPPGGVDTAPAPTPHTAALGAEPVNAS